MRGATRMSSGLHIDKLWAEKPDEDLFHALAHQDEYRPEAIEAVQREIARRNLDVQRTSELEATADIAKLEEAEKAELSLQWPLRILMLLFPLGIPQIILGEYYKHNGYTRKSREVWRWMAYGLLFGFVLIVIRIL